MQSPLVSIIVVAYNSQAHLAECLASLCADDSAPSFEILVVDNASTDGSLAEAQDFAARQPLVNVLASAANRGYAGGVNLGLARAQGAYVAMLNPDMVVTPGWLTCLLNFLESHPEAGAANPLILLHGDEQRINAAGQDVHVTGLGFNRWLGQPRDRMQDARPRRVSGIQGGAFLIRREILDRAGGWDERGFLYHEDVELSWLLSLMGYDLYCVPAAVVRHHYHLSMYPEKLFLLERNRWAMLLTHLRPLSLIVLAPFLLTTELMMWGYCLLRGWAFVRAKAASLAWIAGQRAQLAARRQTVERLRRREDWQVLRRLRWNYAWNQFLTLGRERGPSSRQPVGGPSVKIGEQA